MSQTASPVAIGGAERAFATETKQTTRTAPDAVYTEGESPVLLPTRKTVHRKYVGGELAKSIPLALAGEVWLARLHGPTGSMHVHVGRFQSRYSPGQRERLASHRRRPGYPSAHEDGQWIGVRLPVSRCRPPRGRGGTDEAYRRNHRTGGRTERTPRKRSSRFAGTSVSRRRRWNEGTARGLERNGQSHRPSRIRRSVGSENFARMRNYIETLFIHGVYQLDY